MVNMVYCMFERHHMLVRYFAFDWCEPYEVPYNECTFVQKIYLVKHPSPLIFQFSQAVASFMSQAVGNSVSFIPSQLVFTNGVSSAIETLCFCIADAGHAFLVPTPYYPGYLFVPLS